MKKKSTFFIITIWIYVLIFFFFTPRLLSFIVVSPNSIATSGVIIFVIIFNIFFYYIVYNILSIIFSIINRGKLIRKTKNIQINKLSNIAILYLTKDDFNERACISCMNQNYKNCNLYILDDSTSHHS